jgi:hypothetical protein
VTEKSDQYPNPFGSPLVWLSGSGSGRPKNIRIRIPNTADRKQYHMQKSCEYLLSFLFPFLIRNFLLTFSGPSTLVYNTRKKINLEAYFNMATPKGPWWVMTGPKVRRSSAPPPPPGPITPEPLPPPSPHTIFLRLSNRLLSYTIEFSSNFTHKK